MAASPEEDFTRIKQVANDNITWVEWNPRLRRHVHRAASKGETVNLPDYAVEAFNDLWERETKAGLTGRGVGMPRVLSPEDYEAWTAEETAAVAPENALSDSQINALKADDLIAQLNRNPALAERVLDLENARKYKRKPIISLAERLIALRNGEDISLADKSTESSNLLLPSEA